MKASLLIAGLLGAVVGVAAGIGFIPGVAERLTAPPAPITTGTARVGGPFALQDGQGRTVTDRDFAGTPRLVVFAFTRCGQPCAATLQISTELATRLERVGERIGE